MAVRLIIEGNSVYEIDETCMHEKSRMAGGRKTGRTGTDGNRRIGRTNIKKSDESNVNKES